MNVLEHETEFVNDALVDAHGEASAIASSGNVVSDVDAFDIWNQVHVTGTARIAAGRER